MSIKVRLTEDEENIILSAEMAKRKGIERDHVHMIRALSNIIEESNVDAERIEELNKKYKLTEVKGRKQHMYRCSAKSVNKLWQMRMDYHYSMEKIVWAILYDKKEKMLASTDKQGI